MQLQSESANALIIFARRPVPGKVKTRLAADVGDAAALRIYIRLLEHTRAVARQSGCDTHVYVTELPAEDFWDGFPSELQADGHLGERMMQAFAGLFEKGYKRVIIIGSDCPHLEAADIDHAFEKLADVDVVLGPAADGGYYLLGMKRLRAALFQNKTWSSNSVLAQTMADIREGGLSWALLRELHDVDELKDVPEDWI